MHRTRRILMIVSLCLVSVVVAISTIWAQGSTTGTVSIESKSVALGVGVSWGDGVLEYRGKKYPFSVQGLSVVDLGVSKVSASGNVKNLQKPEDFTGTYVAAGAGGAVGGGAGVAALKNQNGVEMTLTATTQGVRLTVAAAGVDIKLKQ